NYNYFEQKNNMEEDIPDGWRELATVGGLGQLFAQIVRKKLFQENKQESVRSTHRITRIKTVLEYIEKHYQSPITLSELAEVAGMNPQYFCRAFKEVTMQSPMDYVIYYRLEQAVRLLSATDLSVMEVAMECGFNDCSYFIRVFKKQKNITPNQYRKQKSFAG
ncbi:MAG: helix-turn-helix transcriptional regulator, partial [Lachnospiraceae bacterium]|nr:helix-turn-helix transcriptional regulator [Lachnospiraceae bacterium]